MQGSSAESLRSFGATFTATRSACRAENPERLRSTAMDALDLGLEVWFSPELWDRHGDETLAYLGTAARTAHVLEERWPGPHRLQRGERVDPLHARDRSRCERPEAPGKPQAHGDPTLGAHNAPLNAFLRRASSVVRAEFHGPVTYASLPFEAVDWSPFDWVGGDFYRDSRGRDRYGEVLQRFRGFGKPLANMEFGCCTFRGAEDLGGRGWQIFDYRRRTPRLTGDYVYDQSSQAREVEDLLRANESAGVDATFVFTFVQPPQEAPPRERRRLARAPFDLDIISYSLVKWLPDGMHGTAYPEMSWEPKESFRAVADFYASH